MSGRGRGGARRSKRARVTKTPYEAEVVPKRKKSGEKGPTEPATVQVSDDVNTDKDASPQNTSSDVVKALSDKVEVLAQKQATQAKSIDTLIALNQQLVDSLQTQQQGPSNPVAPQIILHGTQASLSYQTQGRDLMSNSADAEELISEGIQKKIKEGSYVSFKSLLMSCESDSTDEDDDDDRDVVPRGGTIKSVKRKKKIAFITWDQWVKAWDIFSDLTISNNRLKPELSGEMAKHFRTVQDLKEKGRDWYFYDKKFRKSLARGKTNNMSYGKIHDTHWLIAFAKEISKEPVPFGGPSGKANPKSNGNIFVPLTFCQKFHKTGNCPRNDCKYKHDCFVCAKGKHPAHRCNMRFRYKPGSMPSPSGPGNKQ